MQGSPQVNALGVVTRGPRFSNATLVAIRFLGFSSANDNLVDGYLGAMST